MAYAALIQLLSKHPGFEMKYLIDIRLLLVLVSAATCGLSSVSAQAEEPVSTGLSADIPKTALETIDLVPGESFVDQLPATLDELKSLETATVNLVPDYQKATVGIQVGGGQGSGVVISPQGHVLTAAHVVGEVGNRVTIVFPDGRRHLARVAGVDSGADAAIVRTEGKGPYPYIPMAENHFAIPGRWVIAIGHPNGYAANRLPVVRLGRVIQCTDETVQTDCSLVGGDSGGPLFDLHGRVVGIHSRIGINNSINFHVPVQTYLNDWDDLSNGFTPKHELAGVDGEDAEENPEEMARPQKAYLGIRGRDATTQGCLITEVTVNGPAQTGGLQRGDIIRECDDEKVQSFADLVATLKTKKPDETVKFQILRGNRKLTKEVTLGGTEI